MRKKPETAPPAPYLRSAGGKSAKVQRTTRKTDDGRWLYRIRYSYNVLGNQLWTLQDLIDSGCRWLQRKPADLNLRGPS